MTIHLTISRADEVVDLVQASIRNNIPYDAIISIEHPGAKNLTAEKGRAPRLNQEIGVEWKDKQLILVCYDVEHSNFGVPAPEQNIVTDAIKFINDRMPAHRPMRLLIHCRSGKARSAGLGLVLLASENNLSPDAALAQLIKIRPIAAPNLAIVEQGDLLLGQKGALIKAVLADPNVTERRAASERARVHQVESRRIMPKP